MLKMNKMAVKKTKVKVTMTFGDFKHKEANEGVQKSVSEKN